jgi:hypothetical protein
MDQALLWRTIQAVVVGGIVAGIVITPMILFG